MYVNISIIKYDKRKALTYISRHLKSFYYAVAIDYMILIAFNCGEFLPTSDVARATLGGLKPPNVIQPKNES